ncbi:hypothetical protein M2272_000923 [Mycobacterium frederiksbergense]|uniref:Uncharacterized protein n=1 Tax=Mycolicibacterium frederiksbergense TaxID=117567 RepID=A0ABT6KUB7_9MYCO|nr:hypothetical protein [Mycolicibacterium frederiksbergense]
MGVTHSREVSRQLPRTHLRHRTGHTRHSLNSANNSNCRPRRMYLMDVNNLAGNVPDVGP